MRILFEIKINKNIKLILTVVEYCDAIITEQTQCLIVF